MPFAGGITGTENGTLLLSVLSAVTYLYLVSRPPELKRAIIKTLGVGLLAVLAIEADGPAFLIAALGFGAGGDFFLAFTGERMFLAGLVSFLIAHIAYIVLFLQDAGSEPPFFDWQMWRLVLLVLLAVHGAVMAVRLWRAVPGDLRLPVMVYIAAIMAMVASALAFTPAVVVAGALLFAASDTILATERFLLPDDSRHRAWTGPAIWVTYYTAQAIIAIAYLP